MFTGNTADFFNGLNNANLIIGIHDGYKYGSGLNSCFQFFQVYQSICFYLQVGYLTAQLFNMFTGIQYSFVFCSGSNNMVAFAGIHLKNTFYAQVITFGCPGSKNDFLGVGTN